MRVKNLAFLQFAAFETAQNPFFSWQGDEGKRANEAVHCLPFVTRLQLKRNVVGFCGSVERPSRLHRIADNVRLHAACFERL